MPISGSIQDIRLARPLPRPPSTVERKLRNPTSAKQTEFSSPILVRRTGIRFFDTEKKGRNMNIQKITFAAFLILAGSGCAMDAKEADSESVGTTDQNLVVGKTNFLRNLSTQYCLDSNASGSVYTNGCYWATYQGWNVSQGTYGLKLQNLATGRCLDSNTSGSVYTLPCNGGSFQEWTETWTNGTISLKNVATGRVLDSNTSRDVYTKWANGGNFQQWQNYYNP
jgi:serine/threonine-protein kinase